MTVGHPVKRRKKLIEVAIPLEAINAASAREKSIRHGHPSTLHLWWARRPLAAARAVIFCQMVDDPSAVTEEFPTEEDQEKERLRLFALISELVLWESTTNEEVLERAREEIRRSWRRCCADNASHPEATELFNPGKLPGFHDPFAGGGALPLEAQRLGLESYASDLNPVAVLINKAMIEIPPKFAGMPPVNPEARGKKQLIAKEWKGAQGLAEDVRYYGQWMRDEAEKRIGHLYPKVKITAEMVNDPKNPRPDLKPYEGQELTVIAWLWARTVKSPNPAFFWNPPEDAKVTCDEVFGPVVCVYPFDKPEEAVKRANALPVCFQSAVFTRDIDRAFYYVRNLQATAVMVNDHTAFRVDWMPFGGRMQSGLGMGGIPRSMEDMTAEKMFVVRTTA